MGFLSKFFKKESIQNKTPRGYHLLPVKEIKRETQKAVQITFSIPEALQQKFQFKPGQYINVSLPIEDKEERRSYSICSAPSSESFSVAVKEVEQGTVSRYLNNDLRVEDELYISEPEGSFSLSEEDGLFVGIAAGSGITPVMSMIETVIAQKPSSKFVLIYGNSTEADVIFADRIKALEQKENFDVVHFRSQEKIDGCIEGRITQDSLQDYLKKSTPLLQSDAFYLCGPEEMIVNSKKALETFGVKSEKIKYELFTTPASDELSHKEKAEAKGEKFKGKAQVKVILDDEEVSFELDASGESVLEAAMGQGLDAPYSCQGGVCCTCKAKVLEGKVKMDQNFSLTDQEVEEGYVLTCQSHPNSKTLTVTYDE